jgi:hypothetical protein
MKARGIHTAQSIPNIGRNVHTLFFAVTQPALIRFGLFRKRKIVRAKLSGKIANVPWRGSTTKRNGSYSNEASDSVYDFMSSLLEFLTVKVQNLSCPILTHRSLSTLTV